MSKLHTASIAALFLVGATFAQAQQPQQQPQPSTSEAEGTAADQTRPGATPTQGAPTQAEDPRPSTSETEGTAADTTPPGRTPTTQDSSAQRSGQGSELVGAAVVSPSKAPIGQVVEVVFDAKDRPEFVVISVEDQSVAVPYSVASSMKSADKIVMEPAKLQAAPKVKQGEWRTESGSWKTESTRYWNRG